MNLEFEAKVFKALPLKSGMGQRGPWSRATVIFEVQNGRYTEKIACENSSSAAEAFSRLRPGQTVRIKADVSSREYQDKYYTTVVCYDFTVLDAPQAPAKEEDNLPF